MQTLFSQVKHEQVSKRMVKRLAAKARNIEGFNIQSESLILSRIRVCISWQLSYVVIQQGWEVVSYRRDSVGSSTAGCLQNIGITMFYSVLKRLRCMVNCKKYSVSA